jgi:hypothetical protein
MMVGAPLCRFAPKLPSNRQNQRGAHRHLREDDNKTDENAVFPAEAWLGPRI